jgi:hypothetical protein
VKPSAKGLKLDLRPVGREERKKFDAKEKKRRETKGGKPRGKNTTVEEMLKVLV